MPPSTATSWTPNQELIALGVSNIGAGLVQGFAIDASVSRTSVADEAGQRSQLSGLVNLVLLILTLALLTSFFADLPKATLAAIVIAAVLPLLKTASLRRLYRIDAADFSIAAVCLTGVLVLGVLGGIAVAVIASLVALVYRGFRPEVAVLGRSRSRETDEDIGFRDVSRHRDVETYPGLVIFRFDQEVFFANANYFRDQIRHLIATSDPPPRAIIIDGAAISHIDTTDSTCSPNSTRTLDRGHHPELRQSQRPRPGHVRPRGPRRTLRAPRLLPHHHSRSGSAHDRREVRCAPSFPLTAPLSTRACSMDRASNESPRRRRWSSDSLGHGPPLRLVAVGVGG